MTDEWATRMSPDITRKYGVEEIHTVCFEPNDWPGKGPVVEMSIPECETTFTVPTGNDQTTTYMNRPPTNHNTRRWLNFVCETATEMRCYLIFNCDTAQQAARAAKQAGERLPYHRRAALERLYSAASRGRGNLA